MFSTESSTFEVEEHKKIKKSKEKEKEENDVLLVTEKDLKQRDIDIDAKKERKDVGEKLLNSAIESYEISYEEMITYSNDVILITSQIKDLRRRCQNVILSL
ncbi:hypothetical protein POTOM_050071 [Populus tomentosa]|uniref:Uncharacterized protein n=1 Tax=Populus tomentosa TaxID=118781 RepID=A0A8X7Y3J2_POPTO|nr:hypothetical protein POTOM_050071 [Populus tomentosa]